jgi:hypothetical protein
LRVEAKGDMAAAVEQWRDYIAGETLAVDLNGATFEPSFQSESTDGVRIALVKAGS